MMASYNKTLHEYSIATGGTDCASMKDVRPDATDACKVDFAALTKECNEENWYGMKDGKPCVLLKLNKIYGWSPDLWEKDDKKVPKSIENYEPDKIWVYCHGENPADEENIGLSDIKYYPQQGFPLAYYPYKKQEDYLSPLVFVQFNSVTKNLGLMVECKAYAKNIRVDQMEKQGSVHFELLVEK
jgi:sodium/potassium-transporting ATPase subunit beta